MMQRCYNPDHQYYSYYGGRGITVNDRWHDVRVFVVDISNQLGPRPAGYTLNRINNDGPYTSDNVEWASYLTQNQTRSKPQPGAKFSPQQIADMRDMRSQRIVLREIAAKYNISIATAQRLTRDAPNARLSTHKTADRIKDMKPEVETRGGEKIDWANAKAGKPLPEAPEPVTRAGAPDDYLLDDPYDAGESQALSEGTE